MLRPQDWLLLFLSLPGGQYRTDQVRLIKGLFLFAQEGPEEVRDLYHFRAYHWGPFDPEVYRDAKALVEAGLVRSERISGTTRVAYEVTTVGENRATELRAHVAPDTLQCLEEIKGLITDLQFDGVLRYVYGKYPSFSVNTMAQFARDQDRGLPNVDDVRAYIMHSPDWLEAIQEGMTEESEGRLVKAKDFFRSLK